MSTKHIALTVILLFAFAVWWIVLWAEGDIDRWTDIDSWSS